MERHKALDKVEANSAVPAETAMTEDDILDAVMADMEVKEVPKMVVFEKPKKENRFKF